MGRLLFVMALSVLAGRVSAETYTGYGLVTGVTVGVGWARAKVASMVSAEGCPRQDWYAMQFDAQSGREMYAAVLAAKVSGQKLRFQLHGCYSDYPRINHVYVCESAQCT